MITKTWSSLFQGGDAIKSIEIPMIQRDYAQGRTDEKTSRIRRTFLQVLHNALTNDAQSAVLDFIYGDVVEGKLIPLDGQQRLTTLFLLHWYIAAHEGIDDSGTGILSKFTYQTRFSSRDFCAALATQRPDFSVDKLSAWLADQPWFFSAWRHDPTIRAMLVTLNAIHLLFKDTQNLWPKLVDQAKPAISFHFLPLKDMGLNDALYIKMNSRGKPLTEFENWKAHFEKLIAGVDEKLHHEFTKKVDGIWTDMLWLYRGDNWIVDEEFMRYFHFVTETICYQNGEQAFDDSADFAVAQRIYGAGNAAAADNLRTLFSALDCWCGRDIHGFFEEFLTTADYVCGKVRLFESAYENAVNLFQECTEMYGIREGNRRKFSLQNTLLLYGVLQHLTEKSTDFPPRIRILRNLVLNSVDDIRSEKMGALLRQTAKLIVTGSLDELTAFSTRQADEERAKSRLIEQNPELREVLARLEDDSLLRGCLAVFDLEANNLGTRAATFAELFPEDKSVPYMAISGALLACGDYSQQPSGSDRWYFGSKNQEKRWRSLFTGSAKAGIAKTSTVLLKLLDAMAAIPHVSVVKKLDAIKAAYLAECQAKRLFDQRFYMVKYDAMREGDSGIYVTYWDCLFCMLYVDYMHGYYRNAYLWAIFMKSEAKDGEVTGWFNRGYVEHWLKLEKSGVQIACNQNSFQLQPPSRQKARTADAFDQICTKFNIGDDLILNIAQHTVDGVQYDREDRIERCAALVNALLAM